MKTQTIIKAKRNRKPFITAGKEYELIEEVKAGYKIVNDLGKISVEDRNDFYHDIYTHRYGLEIKGFTINGLITPFIGIVKEEEEEISFGCVLFFFGFVVSYTFKNKYS